MNSVATMPFVGQPEIFEARPTAFESRTVSPVDEAWQEGFGVGYDEIPAFPPREYDDIKQAAWLAGYDAGQERATVERWNGYAEVFDGIDADPWGERFNTSGAFAGHEG